MEIYKQLNRGLTLSNQDLKIKINKLAKQKHFLNKCLFEEQAAHKRTKNFIIKIVSQNFNTIINEIAPNYYKENNSSVKLAPSNLSTTVAQTLVNGPQSPLQNINYSQRNVTVRRKPQKLHNNNKLSPEIKCNTNKPYRYLQIFRDHELKNSESETTIISKTNIDNSSIQEQRVLTNVAAENSNEESPIISETSIDNSCMEEQMVVANDTSSNSTCHSSNLPSIQIESHTIYEHSSNAESEVENKSISEYDTLGLKENTIYNAAYTTPQIKLSQQQKNLEDIKRKSVVCVEGLKKSVYENKTNCNTGLNKDPAGNNKSKSKIAATSVRIDNIISKRPKRKASASVSYTSYFDD